MIKRIQVEEGFLDGLDLTFSPGLNVLIGSRGTGKTSVVELIRFCLGVPGFTDKAQSLEREHALSVLGSGRVTVTVGMNSHDVVVTRTADEDAPRSSGSYERPTILSQNEVELVGLQSAGRLRLLDGVADSRISDGSQEQQLLAQTRSLSTQIYDVRQEISEIASQLTALDAVRADLLAAEKAQAEMTTSLAASKKDQDALTQLGVTTSSAAVRADVFKRTLSALQQFKLRTEGLLSPLPRLEAWPPTGGASDLLTSVRPRLEQAIGHIRQAVGHIVSAVDEATRLESENARQRLETEESARQIRRRLDQLKQGAGAIAHRTAELREKAAQLNALAVLKEEKEGQVGELVTERAGLLDTVDKLRERRYLKRVSSAEMLTRTLGPSIEVSVTRAAQHAEYITALTGALRGSGLHYNVLAPALAEHLSPRELVEAVEGGEVEVFVRFLGLGAERAVRLVNHLQSQGLGEILTANVEDGVVLKLLVGTEYKATDTLSTGQRCTVVLPILLARESGVLVVDQPEDHLDNAFIVHTLVKAIRLRKKSRQVIFSTHNPNIPVLGDAEQVVVLGSDGRRGFVLHAGPLDARESVKAITTIMEGGHDAFKRRAEFYVSHLP